MSSSIMLSRRRSFAPGANEGFRMIDRRPPRTSPISLLRSAIPPRVSSTLVVGDNPGNSVKNAAWPRLSGSDAKRRGGTPAIALGNRSASCVSGGGDGRASRNSNFAASYTPSPSSGEDRKSVGSGKRGDLGG